MAACGTDVTVAMTPETPSSPVFTTSRRTGTANQTRGRRRVGGYRGSYKRTRPDARTRTLGREGSRDVEGRSRRSSALGLGALGVQFAASVAYLSPGVCAT
jgi:hypothetical protein